MNGELLEAAIKPLVNAVIENEREELARRIQYLESIKVFCTTIDVTRTEIEGSRKLNKDRFNVFTCLTRHHLEELHSNFLYYLLNPNETHDCGDLFLTEFCGQLIIEQLPIDLQETLSRELKRTTVLREHYCEVIDGSRTFIDIYIDCPSFIIAIENKINASEQPDQIARYSKYCKKQGKEKFFILYLTKGGDNSLTAREEFYTPISYERHIRKWLERCIELSMKFPIVKTGIKFYLDLLNEKILFQSPNVLIMKMKELLLEPGNLYLLQHIKELTDALTQIRNDLRVNFFKSLSDELDKMKLAFAPVSRILTPISVNKIWDDKHRGFTSFAPELCIQISPNAKVYFCIEHDWHSLWYGLFVVNINTKTGQNGNGYIQVNRIKEIMAIKLADLELTDEWWFCTQYFAFDGYSFGDDGLSYALAKEPQKAVEQFIIELKQYLAVWKVTIEQYMQESAAT